MLLGFVLYFFISEDIILKTNNIKDISMNIENSIEVLSLTPKNITINSILKKDILIEEILINGNKCGKIIIKHNKNTYPLENNCLNSYNTIQKVNIILKSKNIFYKQEKILFIQ